MEGAPIIEDTQEVVKNYNLNKEWCLWAHKPHNTDWSEKSYIGIMNVDNVKDTILLTESLPNKLIENCMLFFMKKGVKPTWEDPQNRNGGSFSYKVSNKNVAQTWRELSYVLLGESISSNKGFVSKVTGITISPKKNFCIIKVWMTDCQFQNPSEVISGIKDINPNGCLFKKHTPEY
jgi:hypothetical protein